MLSSAILTYVMPLLNGFVFELLVCTWIVSQYVPRRRYFFARLCISNVLVLALEMVVNWFIRRSYELQSEIDSARSIYDANVAQMNRNTGLIMRWSGMQSIAFIVLYIACFMLIYACFLVSVRDSIVLLTGAIALQHATYCLIKIPIFMLPRNWQDTSSWFGASVFFIISILVLSACWFVIRHIHTSIIASPTRLRTIIPLLGLILCVNIFSIQFEISLGMVQAHVLSYISMYATRLIMCAFVINSLYDYAGRMRAEQEERTLQTLLDQQQHKYALEKAAVEQINIKAHDLRKQLTLLQSDQRTIGEELQHVNSIVNQYDAASHTGNEPLDIVISNRAAICAHEHISFTRIVDGNCLREMKAVDVYAILANALDNAIEAVQALPTEERSIMLRIWRDMSMTFIHVENPYNHNITMSEDLPETTKSDHVHHGFGLKSIQSTVQQYNGQLYIDASDHIFTLTIALPD